ncbi:cell wall-binding repeat-containing protein [Paramicrobacterium humi]|nr:cell wall-binding repeat-containing protein [Microbacterium humi]
MITQVYLAQPADAATQKVDRLQGSDRYATAVAVSKAGYANGAEVAYLASGENYADALSAAPAAALAGGPLLLTRTKSLPASTAAELKRLKPKSVVIVGADGAVSGTVWNAVKKIVPNMKRVGGKDRFETSRLIVESMGATSGAAFIATGWDYPDALAASAAAGARKGFVVLVPGKDKKEPTAVRNLLTKRAVTDIVIAGGTSVVSSGIEASLKGIATVTRAGGGDRYGTAVAVNKASFDAAATRAFVATGSGYADALTGAALAGTLGAPLYTSRSSCIPDAAFADFASRLNVNQVTLLGGTGVLNNSVAQLKTCGSANDAATKKASEEALLKKLNALLPSLKGVHNVTVRELGGLKRTVSVRGGNRDEPASSIKIFALYGALKRIEQGKLYYSTKLPSGYTLAQCMRAMIHVSDNYCHTDLLQLMGNNNLNAQFASEGYTGTHYAGTWKGTYYSYKTSTTNDMTALLQRLYNGMLLNKSNSTYMISLLKEQIYRMSLPSGLPPGVVQASKPGELWISSGMVQTSAAIVYAPKGAYTLAIMGHNGSTDPSLAAISKLVYEHFNGAFSKTASFAVQQMVTAHSAKLRSSAGGSAIATIPAGAYAEVEAGVRLWYHVKVNGKTGYMSSADLKNRY